MTKLFVVIGCTGEYSGFDEWVVCAYSDEAHARQHAEAAQVQMSEWQATHGRYEDPPKGWNKYDPVGYCDYTGTTYTVQEVELRESLPA